MDHQQTKKSSSKQDSRKTTGEVVAYSESAINLLRKSLGDEWDRYLMLLKTWFRGGTKENFDRQTRLFLTKQQIYFHNKFLLEILNKVGCVSTPVAPIQPKVTEEHESSTHRKRKKTTHSSFEQQAFHPCSPTDFIKEITPNLDPNSAKNPPRTYRYAAQELFLSDHNLVSGRFLIGAWENGLSNVEDSAIELVVSAVQIVLKNILSNCIRKRKHYKVTSEGNFYYDVGSALKDPTLRNTISRQKVDDDTLGMNTRTLTSVYMPKKTNDESLILAACEDSSLQQPRTRISLQDIYNTLMDKNVILSHNVHIQAVEKIVAMMN